MAKSRYLECGKIINTHGVKGAVKVENRCDTPKVLASLKKVFFQRGESTPKRRSSHPPLWAQTCL